MIDVAYAAPIVAVDASHELRLIAHREREVSDHERERNEYLQRDDDVSHARSLSRRVALDVDLLHHPPVDAIPLVDLPLG